VSVRTVSLLIVISGNAGITTKGSNAAIVRNHIDATHVESPYTPSNRLIAFINNKNQATRTINHSTHSISYPKIQIGKSDS
jgi:hypothetical protein